jgi:hypothetical protein
MLKPRHFLIAGLVCAALAACSDGPTLTANVQPPAGPAFDGGHMLGSGGRMEDPGSTTAGVSTGTTVGDSTTAARDGHMLGSGG